MDTFKIKAIQNRIIAGGSITKDEAIALLSTPNKDELYNAADVVRKKFIGRKLDMCSITNAKSGKCEEDCKWCSQSRHFQTKVEEYDLVDKNLAIDMAKRNADQGINRYSLVTSGRAINDSDLDKLLEIYHEINNQAKIETCASMGLLTKPQLEKLKSAGIGHYHCNIETAPSFFNEVCTTHSMEEKIETIKWAKETGLNICSGGILGMGETPEQRVEMAFALADLDVQSIPINILTPIEGTPLSGNQKLTEQEILTAIALFRLINPRAHIRFAGGRNQLSIEMQKKALHAGISAALVGDYLTTLGTKVNQDKAMFIEAGFEVHENIDTKQLSINTK